MSRDDMDVFKPVPWTERDERERRIALWVVAFIFPFFVVWLVFTTLK